MNLTDDGEPLNPVDEDLFEDDENGGIFGDEGEDIAAFDEDEELIFDDAETAEEDALD